jgi:hypothetical protein
MLRSISKLSTKTKDISSRKSTKKCFNYLLTPAINSRLTLKSVLKLLLPIGFLVSLFVSPTTAKANTDSSSIALSIHSANNWIGIDQQFNLWAAKLDREKSEALTFRKTTISQKDKEILQRFILNKGVMKYSKENTSITNEQTEFLKDAVDNGMPPAQKIENITYINLWVGGDFKEVMLINTPSAKEKWPEDLKYLLKLVARITKEAKKFESEGIGFINNLDYQKDETSSWVQWAKMLNNGKEFHTLTEKELKELPTNLKQMVEYPGFIVPLSEQDLILMTALNWTEISEDEKKPSPFDVWWGIINYKEKTYAVNAWKIK